MTVRIIVTGTDTGIGKTVFAAALAGSLGANYWKPIQSGLVEETDSETVLRLSGLSAAQILPEAYRLKTPVSPHLAAELDGVAVDPETLALPKTSGPLVVEGAGGLLVPLTREVTFIEVFKRWQAPVVLCARTTLGTINHTLLSIEAMRARCIPLLGVAFTGEENPDSERIIVEMGHVRRLGRLPHLAPLTADTLRAAFTRHFNPADFLEMSDG
jgi:dethiobiotin synthetase